MIEISNLIKEFSNDTVIHYRDICFETGKTYMLLGASGCGKSTLLNMIAGIITPTSGEISIDGKKINFLSHKERDSFRIKNIGCIFQDFKLIEEMTVLDNIEILKIEHIDTSGSDVILKKLGIYEKKNKTVRTLSGGEKQRVAIARALVKNPDIILADEPTGNLNFEIGKKVIESLIDAAKGKTLIVVTHDSRLSCYFDETVDMNVLTSLSDTGKGADGNV